MIIKSRIKKLFPDELLKLIATTCDTMRINSAQHKMVIDQQLLKKYGIRFSVLGGATNRLSLYIDGYAVKIAVDNQGYVDNLIEYSISKELQPYVTKSYETNGYILIAECVKTLSLDDFKLRRSDIESVLSILAQDYLLGDVGYITKNYTNWGMRDDGSIVILDYAYIHRGNEKLFTCEVCGCGILRYDSTFSYLKCSNSASCNAQFTYIERKMIQGDQIDLDMIEEAKGYSIKLPKGISQKEVSENDDGTLASGNKIVTQSYTKYLEFLTEVNNNMRDYDQNEAMKLMVDLATAKTQEDRERIETKISDIYEESKDEDVPEMVYEPNYDNSIQYPDDELGEEEEPVEPIDTGVIDIDVEDSLSAMVRMAKMTNAEDEEAVESEPEKPFVYDTKPEVPAPSTSIYTVIIDENDTVTNIDELKEEEVTNVEPEEVKDVEVDDSDDCDDLSPDQIREPGVCYNGKRL